LCRQFLIHCPLSFHSMPPQSGDQAVPLSLYVRFECRMPGPALVCERFGSKQLAIWDFTKHRTAMIMESMKITSDRPPNLSDQRRLARGRQPGTSSLTDRSRHLRCPADGLSTADFDGRCCQASDVSELLRNILQLQPHEELDIMMSPIGSPPVSEPASHNGHRGYLMDIELGEVPTICVKRTF
jgi:hypothetical protein